MKTGSFVIVPRLTDEGRNEAVLGRRLFHEGLVEEGAICGIECRAVLEVYLVLAAPELTKRGLRPESECFGAPKEPCLRILSDRSVVRWYTQVKGHENSGGSRFLDLWERVSKIPVRGQEWA
jgi:hypothetical protein